VQEWGFCFGKWSKCANWRQLPEKQQVAIEVRSTWNIVHDTIWCVDDAPSMVHRARSIIHDVRHRMPDVICIVSSAKSCVHSPWNIVPDAFCRDDGLASMVHAVWMRKNGLPQTEVEQNDEQANAREFTFQL